MHPISISLKGSREKPGRPSDGQRGPLRSTRQKEDSPHLPLSAQCHQDGGAEAWPGMLAQGQTSGGFTDIPGDAMGGAGGASPFPAFVSSSPSLGWSRGWFLWHSCAGIPLARRSGTGEACSGWARPGGPSVRSETSGDSGPREKVLAGAQFGAGATDLYVVPLKPPELGRLLLRAWSPSREGGRRGSGQVEPTPITSCNIPHPPECPGAWQNARPHPVSSGGRGERNVHFVVSKKISRNF